MGSAQQLKGCTSHLLSVSSVLFCLTKAVIKLAIARPFLLRFLKCPAPSLSPQPPPAAQDLPNKSLFGGFLG